MRDHYAGDLSDLIKFAVLRALAQDDRTLGIAWYYAPGIDKSVDGRHLEWHHEPHWEELDPALHRWLRNIPERSVAALEDRTFWSLSTRFHRDPLPSSRKREGWSKETEVELAESNLIFLDPDNGLGGSSGKHASYDELASLQQKGRAIGFITFPKRKTHSQQLTELHDQVLARTGSRKVITLRTSVAVPAKRVGYFVPRARWFSFIGLDEVLEARLFQFAALLGKIPRVRTYVESTETALSTEGYRLVYERGNDGGWGAYAPDLPGLGVVGDTFEEAEQLIREGIVIHLDGLKEDGLPIPQPTTLAARVAVAA